MKNKKGAYSFSTSMVLVFFLMFVFLYLWTLKTGTTDLRYSLGSAVFMIFVFMFFIFLTIPNLFGFAKIRSQKIVSEADGFTGRIDKKISLGGGFCELTIIADKTIIPVDKREIYRGLKGFIASIGQFGTMRVKVKESDLIAHGPDKTTCLEGLIWYLGEKGITGVGDTRLDKIREEQYKKMQHNMAIVSDSLETIRSHTENLTKANTQDLANTAKLLNQVVKDMTNATSGSVQATAEILKRTGVQQGGRV
jgi:hypothetical protein